MNWLRLHVSNVCNFKCPNCHVFELTENVQPSQLMSEEIFINSIVLVTNYLIFQDENQLTISLYGGEPLANKKIIKKVIENQAKYFNQQIKINWIINTNGSLINEEDAIFLKNHNIELHISVDGKEETHNLSRTFHNRKPTFSSVISALTKIKNHQIKAQINSYLMPTNLCSLKEIIDIAYDYQIYKIYLDQFYSENMEYNSNFFELYQDIYFYSLQKNVELTGPWTRVKSYFDKNQNRSDDYLNSVVIDINVDGSFYTSSLPHLKHNPIPFDQLSSFLKNDFQVAKKIQAQQYQSNCKQCAIYKQCFGIAKEQVWYHITPHTDTVANCNFFTNWINYLNRPFYVYSEEKFDVISLFPESENLQLTQNLNTLIKELENTLWKLKYKFKLRVVANFIELKYASSQFNLPYWAKATTNKDTLYHLSPIVCQGIKHELVHIFLNQENFSLPTWAIEGICEWINDPIATKSFKSKLSLFELENETFNNSHHLNPKDDPFYQTSKHFYLYLEKLIGREEMCHSLLELNKVDLNQWILSKVGLTLNETYVNFQQFDW